MNTTDHSPTPVTDGVYAELVELEPLCTEFVVRVYADGRRQRHSRVLAHKDGRAYEVRHPLGRVAEQVEAALREVAPELGLQVPEPKKENPSRR
jgi:hypothetical protein